MLNSIQDGTVDDDSLQTMVGGSEFLNPLGGSLNGVDFNEITTREGPNTESLRFSPSSCQQTSMASPPLNHHHSGEFGGAMSPGKKQQAGNQTVLSSKNQQQSSGSTYEDHTQVSGTPSLCVTSTGGDVNGRTFFRSVRQRIDYNRFQTFISVVRSLNAKQISRKDCLNRASELFGADHPDLVEEFGKMLAQHTMVAHAEAC